MCHKLDQRFFAELAAMEPAGVCQRTLCAWHAERACYRVPAWGGVYEVDPVRAMMQPATPETRPVTVESGLAVLFYLLHAQDLPLANEWISEKDLPGGVTFFRGPHAVPAHLIADRFGADLPGFRSAAVSLGSALKDLADAAYVFRVLPRVPVAVLLWAGDEEFGPEAKLLFDRTIASHLPLDVIFGLTVELCNLIAGSGEATKD